MSIGPLIKNCCFPEIGSIKTYTNCHNDIPLVEYNNLYLDEFAATIAPHKGKIIKNHLHERGGDMLQKDIQHFSIS